MKYVLIFVLGALLGGAAVTLESRAGSPVTCTTEQMVEVRRDSNQCVRDGSNALECVAWAREAFCK